MNRHFANCHFCRVTAHLTWALLAIAAVVSLLDISAEINEMAAYLFLGALLIQVGAIVAALIAKGQNYRHH